jgi:hypothetical protein
VEISAYLPSLDIFVPVRIASWYSITGAVRNFVDCHTIRINTGRFQPSIAFEIVVLAFLIVQAFVIARENSNVTSLKQFLSQPWMGLEIATICIFIVILGLDIALNVAVSKVGAQFPWMFADRVKY